MDGLGTRTLEYDCHGWWLLSTHQKNNNNVHRLCLADMTTSSCEVGREEREREGERGSACMYTKLVVRAYSSSARCRAAAASSSHPACRRGSRSTRSGSRRPRRRVGHFGSIDDGFVAGRRRHPAVRLAHLLAHLEHEASVLPRWGRHGWFG
jgi:hypothetical protein